MYNCDSILIFTKFDKKVSMNKFKLYLQLFFDFFKIGLFTFGGGYAMISVISHEIVEKRQYISAEEFSTVVAIAESTPGPIAINSATYIGYKRGGIIGSILASLGVVLPSFIIIFVISLFFDKFMQFELVQKAFKGIQCGVAILIISAAFKLFKNIKKNVASYIMVAVSAIALLAIDIFSVNISTIYFILVGACIGIALYFRPKKAQTEEGKKDEKEGENK